LGITLKSALYKQDAKVLLKSVLSQFFGAASGCVDMVVEHVPSPVAGARAKFEHSYTGPMDLEGVESMIECDSEGPDVIQVIKLYNTSDATAFHTFGRVLSGTAKPGAAVRVLGENYTLDDEEDMVDANISDVWVYETRYKVPVSGVPAGNWVLLGGVDNSIVKSATIVQKKMDDDRSEEHTSELQSRENIVCRLLLEKKKKENHRR